MVDLHMKNMKSRKKQNLSLDGFLNDWDKYPISVDQVGKPGNIPFFLKTRVKVVYSFRRNFNVFLLLKIQVNELRINVRSNPKEKMEKIN